MIDERKSDDGGEAVRRLNRGRAHPPRALRRIGGRLAAPCPLLAPQREEPVLHLATVMISHASVRNLGEQGFEPRLEGGAPLRGVGRMSLELPLPQHVDQWTGAGKK